MKISTRHDIAAPPGEVFAALSDFDRLERLLMESGAEVSRTDDRSHGPAGATWTAKFTYRGRTRRAEASVVTFDLDQQIAMRTKIDGLVTIANTELLPIGDSKTRMFAAIDLRPTTFTSRLLVQSLKLGRGRLQKRLKKRLIQFGDHVEASR
ncbi:SRPBCC family protein [Palleronia caenipelagi]|uniref:SRPBCC family protein n=1 Tax=Palleronia caenipelagi TaxID=2489174 RepID=A0A547Q9Q3_9RHOB|nr:SRPBCC family protein [Palleronia caenipelagi]TRD23117.1 SRPBCC family protein [Palleronia caenipelagi]